MGPRVPDTVAGHEFLAESANGGRDKWRAAIDIVETLKPRWIVAGHKNKALDDAAERTIIQSREYLDTADELFLQNTTALGFFNAMLQQYPDRLNPGALWMGAAKYRVNQRDAQSIGGSPV